MGLVDFILNLAGLLLWLNWRSVRFDPLGKRTPATLIGTLRRAEPRRWRRWHLLAALGGLLLLRAGFYWQIGSAAHWTGTLNLSVITLSFRSDFFARMLWFSFFSFGLTLGVFYLWLLLLSILAGPEPIHRLVRMQLGRIDGWPRGVKLFLPLAITAAFWQAASRLLTWLQIIPKPVSAAQQIEAALIVGLNSYLVWKYVIAALLALHLLNSYIYFGKNPFWSYVNAEARTLLSPLRALPLQAGKVDFAPVVGLALVFLVAELAGRGLFFLYGRLPF
jgi:uncharacterized protein YggT (Ycf19 family)